MELLSIVKEVGFKQVELFTNKKLLDDKTADIARQFDFEYIVHSPVDFFDNSVIDFAIKIGAKMIVFHYGPDMKIDELKKLVKRARNYDIQLCVENTPGQRAPTALYKTPITPEDFYKIKEQVPEVKLCLDIEHAMVAQVFPRIVKVVGKDICYVHVTGYPRYHSPPFLNRSMFEIWIRELKSVGYDGIVTAEMDKEYQVEEIFRKLKDFFNEFADKK